MKTIILMSLLLSERLLGFGFNSTFWMKDTPCIGTIVRGTNAADNCYTGSTSAAAIAAGKAKTPTGKCLVYSDAYSGFKVWTEEGRPASQAKILKANGLDSWQTHLNGNGKGYSANYATAALIGIIEGRKCPTNVYIDDSNKVTTNNCMYYSGTFGAQAMNSNGDDSGAFYGFSTWASGVWYRGNIYQCSYYGMRLPTFYETNSNYPGATGMPVDASPTFAGATGVPDGGGDTWTATTYTAVANNYVS